MKARYEKQREVFSNESFYAGCQMPTFVVTRGSTVRFFSLVSGLLDGPF